MFQRVCARADFPVEYSQGFNPHSRLSLPLPRSVGLEVDEDVLSVKIQTEKSQFDTEDFQARLSTQLPQGCEILSVNVAQTGDAIRPTGATYVLEVQQDYLDENLSKRIEGILTRDTISLQRRIDEKGQIRNVEVRSYLGAISVRDNRIAIECNISPAGSIRVDEILELLEMDVTKLASPVRRTNIRWENN